MTEQERIRKLAEKFMGWHLVEFASFLCWADESGRVAFRVVDWNPLTSLDHAWMLVEKANENGECLFLYQANIETWHATFDEADIDPWWSEATTAPLAICAAVERLMEER